MAKTSSPVFATRAEAISAFTAKGEPYELIVEEVRGQPQKVFRNAPATLRALYSETASEYPFIIFEDERLTFAEAWEKAGRIGHLLVDKYGVQKGDRVAISMRNYPEWMLAFTAITSIGAIAVALNALWQPHELAYGLSDCGAKVLFADQERLERLVECIEEPEIEVIAVRPSGAPLRGQELELLLEQLGVGGMPSADVAADDDATIFYTSGSSGPPKGVVSTHRNIISALYSWDLDLVVGGAVTSESPTRQPATLLAVPLFHVTGSHAVYLQSYRAQRKLVCMYRWDPERATALIEEERITTFTGPAAMTGDLVRVASNSARDMSSLLWVGGGGAPRAPEQVRRIDASFAKANPATAWGMTETNAIGTAIGGADYLKRPTSSGRCSAVLELKVVDDMGRAVSTGERGELLVRGTAVFRGYWYHGDLIDECFEDGWFRTGDVAYIDGEGFLFIVDRIKDLIIRGGENIGCGQVEAALEMHPEVHEAAVYAVPDERLGEEVAATVYGVPGLRAESLQSFLKGRLARFEIPRYITVFEQPLPRTASGKIMKRELREKFLADRD